MLQRMSKTLTNILIDLDSFVCTVKCLRQWEGWLAVAEANMAVMVGIKWGFLHASIIVRPKCWLLPVKPLTFTISVIPFPFY